MSDRRTNWNRDSAGIEWVWVKSIDTPIAIAVLPFENLSHNLRLSRNVRQTS
jgi:hypothetical protein